MSHVVFGKRGNKSYEVTFFDAKQHVQTWTGDHGGPHVETPDDVPEGEVRQLSLHKKQPPARFGNVIFHVQGVSNDGSDYGGHITVPMAVAGVVMQGKGKGKGKGK
eukprot:SAG22_NODE_4222_length_1337_cov_1.638126_2_plen_106_part_00